MNCIWKRGNSFGKFEKNEESGLEFSKEMLEGTPTATIPFDWIQKHPERGYVIVKYLLCDEKKKEAPYTSHPNQLWDKYAKKFFALWRAKCDFDATLYLVNYAKKGSKHQDEILLIKVLDMNENGITKEMSWKYTRSEFSKEFQKFNRECLVDKNVVLEDIYRNQPMIENGNIVLQEGEYKGRKIDEIYHDDKRYLEWLGSSDNQYSSAARVYIEQREDELRRR